MDKLQAWLEMAIESESSDLHLVSHYPPILRTHGKLIAIPSEPALQPENMWQVLSPVVDGLPNDLDGRVYQTVAC